MCYWCWSTPLFLRSSWTGHEAVVPACNIVFVYRTSYSSSCHAGQSGLQGGRQYRLLCLAHLASHLACRRTSQPSLCKCHLSTSWSMSFFNLWGCILREALHTHLCWKPILLHLHWYSMRHDTCHIRLITGSHFMSWYALTASMQGTHAILGHPARYDILSMFEEFQDSFLTGTVHYNSPFESKARYHRSCMNSEMPNYVSHLLIQSH